MAPQNNRAGRVRRQRKRRGVKSQRYNLSVTTTPGMFNMLKLARIALACLPITNVTILSLFDIAFSLVKTTLNKVDYYNGAFAMFKVTIGSLVTNSPLLAKIGDTDTYSFPGYPIAVKWLRVHLRNTTMNSQRSGRWSAVFIPFRDVLDESHFSKVIPRLTFEEVSVMPHAKTTDARHDIALFFKMTDKTMYCARPREFTEGIGLVIVFWDVASRDNITEPPTTSDFSCELEVTALCKPYVIFGPQHRIKYTGDDLKIKSITTGKEILIVDRDLDQVRIEPYLK